MTLVHLFIFVLFVVYYAVATIAGIGTTIRGLIKAEKKIMKNFLLVLIYEYVGAY